MPFEFGPPPSRFSFGAPPTRKKIRFPGDEEDDNPWWEDLGIAATRIVPAIGGTIAGGALGALAGGVGAVPGAVAGGAAGSALGEWLAQLYEKSDKRREAINPGQIAMQGAIGAVPFGKGGGVALNALKGAGLGAASTVGTRYAETGDLPTMGEIGVGAATGGAFGGGVAKLAQMLRVKPPAAIPETQVPRVSPPVRDRLAPFVVPTGADELSRGPQRIVPVGREAEALATEAFPLRPSKKPLQHAGIDTRAENPEWAASQKIDIAANPEAYQAAKRGRMSIPQIEELASREAIKPLKVGQAFKSPEQYLAYERQNKMLADRQRDLLLKGPLETAEQAELDTINKTLPGYARAVYGGRSETARTMRMMQVEIGGKMRSIPDLGLKEALRLGMTDADITALMEKAGSDPDKWVSNLMKYDTAKGGTVMDRINSYLTFNALSAPATQARNALGNLVNLGVKPAITPVAAGWDALRTTLKLQPERTIYAREAGEQLKGIAKAIPEAASQVGEVMKKGYSLKNLTSTGGLDTPRREFVGGSKNPANYVGRLMTGVDLAFREMAGGGEQAARLSSLPDIAKTRGIQAGTPEYQALVETAISEAAKEAPRASFQEAPGAIVSGAIGIKKKAPWLHPMFMFVKTPGAIIKQGFEASPFGFFMERANRSKVGDRIANETQAKAAMGTSALGGLFALAVNGKLSGAGPVDPAKKAELYESGWRPNSINIGGKWVPYGWAQPLALPVSLVANAVEAWNTRTEKGERDIDPLDLMTKTMLQTGNSLLDQSFLAGVADLFAAVQDPDRGGKAWATRMLSTAVPASAALRTATNIKDPIVRRPENIPQGVKAGIPGMSEQVNPRLDRFGQPVRKLGNAVQRGMNVLVPSPEVSDPVAEMLGRVGKNLTPATPVKSIKIGREDVQLNSKDAFILGQAKGQALYRMLKPIMDRQSFNAMPEEQQKRVLDRSISASRRVVLMRAKNLVSKGKPLTLEDLLRGIL